MVKLTGLTSVIDIYPDYVITTPDFFPYDNEWWAKKLQQIA